MNTSNFLSRLKLVVLLLVANMAVHAQTYQSSTKIPSATTIHHWQEKASLVLPASVQDLYKGLPAATYTPAINIAGWSAGSGLEAFSRDYKGRKFSALLMLTVDENATIRTVQVISINDASAVKTLGALLLDSKLSDPSYVQNTPVASYYPCTVSIINQQLSIL